MNSTQWIIKLLSGPHAGAEMSLDNKFYQVGSSEECDIVIHDKSFATIAFSISVGSAGIKVQNLESSQLLYVGGKATESNEITVEEYIVYSLGILHFCFGPSDAQWPEISIPEIEGPEIAEIAEIAEIESPDTLVDDKIDLSNDLNEDKTTVSIERVAKVGTQRPRWSRASKLGFNLVIFVVSVSSGVVFNMTRLDAETANPQLSVDVSSIVTKDLQMPGLTVTQQTLLGKPPIWHISGYVRSVAEEGSLKELLLSLDIIFELDIRVMDRIQRSTQSLLKQFKLDHLVVSIGDKPGSLVIDGVEPELNRWKRMKPILLADIPGLIHIVDQVESPQSRLSVLKQWVQEEGLDKDVVVNARDGRLSITSDISLESSEKWQRITKRYNDEFGGSLDLTVMNRNRPLLDVRSVSLGQFPYVVLADGRRYSKGSHISQGYYLEHIGKDTVVLKRGDELIKYGMRRASL